MRASATAAYFRHSFPRRSQRATRTGQASGAAILFDLPTVRQESFDQEDAM
jgi:hypothetical protein